MYMFSKMDVKHNLLTVGLYFFPRGEQALPYPSPDDLASRGSPVVRRWMGLSSVLPEL
jgi:hypothetical protein